MDSSLLDISKETQIQLNILWDEIGLTPAERDIQLQQLTKDVVLLYQTKLKNERLLRDDLKNQVVQSIESIQKLLDILADPSQVT